MLSYQELLRDVMANGEGHADRTGVGTTSVFGRQWRHRMSEGFPLLTTKKVPLRWVFEELRWFLSGSTDEADLAKAGVDIWKEWATAEQCAKFGREAGDLGHVYGGLWRDFFPQFKNYLASDEIPRGNDQIKSLLSELTSNPNSRRLIVTGWNPVEQFKVALPPCHTLWQCKVHQDNSLSLHLYARSIDIFLGLPFNIASYAMLLEMIAFATSRVANELVISFGDLHLYNNHREQAELQLSREPHELPTVAIVAGVKDSPLETLLSIEWKDVVLSGYECHPAIQADVAV